jgi:hypothetical protein
LPLCVARNSWRSSGSFEKLLAHWIWILKFPIFREKYRPMNALNQEEFSYVRDRNGKELQRVEKTAKSFTRVNFIQELSLSGAFTRRPTRVHSREIKKPHRQKQRTPVCVYLLVSNRSYWN